MMYYVLMIFIYADKMPRTWDCVDGYPTIERCWQDAENISKGIRSQWGFDDNRYICLPSKERIKTKPKACVEHYKE